MEQKRGELFDLAPNRDLRRCRTEPRPRLSSVGRVLFPIPGIDTRRSYAVSGEGRRFLIGRPLKSTTSEPITVVVNSLA